MAGGGQEAEEARREGRYRERVWREPKPISGGAKRGDPGYTTPGKIARGTWRGASKVTNRGRYSAGGMLTAELLAGAGIVALRMVADYEPQADGTLKGKIGHPKGQYGPFPILAGLLGTFFLLSFLAARGGTKAKVAVIAGALIDLVLAMKSMDEVNKTAATFSHFGKAKLPKGAWQTSGTAAGEPIAGSLATGPTSGGSSSSKGSDPQNAHPGGDYTSRPPTGTIQAQANPLLAMGLRLSGWLGPFHWDQAQAELKNTGH